MKYSDKLAKQRPMKNMSEISYNNVVHRKTRKLVWGDSNSATNFWLRRTGRRETAREIQLYASGYIQVTHNIHMKMSTTTKPVNIITIHAHARTRTDTHRNHHPAHTQKMHNWLIHTEFSFFYQYLSMYIHSLLCSLKCQLLNSSFPFLFPVFKYVTICLSIQSCNFCSFVGTHPR